MNDENLKPAKKGEVRNPNGRPKGSKNRATIARQILGMSATMPKEVFDRIKKIYPSVADTMTVEEVATLTLITRAIMNGDHRAYKAVMDSAYGQPKQVIETDDITNKQKDPSEMTDEELDAELSRLDYEDVEEFTDDDDE